MPGIILEDCIDFVFSPPSLYVSVLCTLLQRDNGFSGWCQNYIHVLGQMIVVSQWSREPFWGSLLDAQKSCKLQWEQLHFRMAIIRAITIYTKYWAKLLHILSMSENWTESGLRNNSHQDPSLLSVGSETQSLCILCLLNHWHSLRLTLPRLHNNESINEQENTCNLYYL